MINKVALLLMMVSIGTCTLVDIVPAVASAGSARDGRHDTWAPYAGDRWRPSESRPNSDLRRIVVRNAHVFVTVKAEYFDLRENTDENELLIDVKSAKHSWSLSSRFNPIYRDGYFVLTHLRSGGVVDCPLSGRVDYDANTMRVRVPRHCLHNPRWVRYRGFERWYHEEQGVSYDDVLTRRAPTDGWSRPVKSTPRTA
jgi:hypothetical protein